MHIKTQFFIASKKRYTIMRSLERATNQTDSFGMDERVSLLKATIELLEALDGIEIHGLNGLEFVPENLQRLCKKDGNDFHRFFTSFHRHTFRY